MNMHKIIAAIAVTGAVALSGCSTEPGGYTPNNQSDTQTGTGYYPAIFAEAWDLLSADARNVTCSDWENQPGLFIDGYMYGWNVMSSGLPTPSRDEVATEMRKVC